MSRLLRTAFVSLLFCLTGLGGCASLPPPQPRPAVQALADPESTALGKLVAAAAPAPGISGFRVLASGDDAFAALTALADRAQKTLDLQYYLIHSDESSRALMQRVRAAADRGVRVRLLLDDLNTAGQDDALMRLTRHPRIEVRLYNPFPSGRMATMSRVMASLTDIGRINHRMHNKMFVADNALAATGGRNLGDAYFVQSAQSNFLDVDVLVAGPAVRALSAVFDGFWNDPLAYPIDVVTGAPPAVASEAPAPDHPASALAGEAAASAPAIVTSAAKSPLGSELARNQLKLVWAPSRVLADKPTKASAPTDAEQPASPHEVISDDVEGLLRGARSEVLLISPYFVPGARGMALIDDLKRRGVRLRVLTNSLATTDAPAVHTGYARYREPMLKAGVDLRELRVHLDLPRSKVGSFGSSQASLHAKVLVIDQRDVLIGSMNMDPRSARLNTEMGVVMHSPEIARQMLQLYDEVASANSYRLSLDPDGRLLWTLSPPGGAPQVLDSEPEASLWLKLTVKLLSPFAPEEML
ncbi:phospholipase D family protein [Rhizobacter sp. SG703]|uniref:phospholipase D-like domain-containing protein n=1 Tax=Rhizobacter sp. SG703 TaxID=2587140 RepID=UPI001445BA2A|nr:phospholipase D family protein [Rhizobacter sp. SG703]NKI94364.1 phosphatidylserine/phosphatidylglycerophosphate/cardiolipin synthase-like enzyme [Rhizobacter sp. SG703]